MTKTIKYMSILFRNVIFPKSTKSNAKNNTGIGIGRIGALGYRGGALGYEGVDLKAGVGETMPP